MDFEWDVEKNRLNIQKHGMSFEEAIEVFDDLHLSHVDSREDYGEERAITIGLIGGIVVAIVVHTNRKDRIRIISARKANKRERKKYHAYYAQKTGKHFTDLEEAT